MTVLGEIKKGSQIGKLGAAGYASYIWHACVCCGKERWVNFLKGQPVNLHCHACANKNGRPHRMPHTEEAKRKMSLARLGVPNPLNRQKSKEVNGVEHFECSKCHSFLKREAFYKDKRSFSGVKSHCKACHIETSIRTRDPDNTRRLKREHEARRRAWKAGSYVERISFKAIELRDRMVCGLCGKKVKAKDLSFDHIIPLSCGGAHADWNLQVAHLSCNCRKRTGVIPSQTRLEFGLFPQAGR